MDELELVADWGIAVAAARQQAAIAEEEAREEKRRTREAALLARLRDKLGLEGAEHETLWAALHPQMQAGDLSVSAFGVKGYIYGDLSGWRNREITGGVNWATLALFVAWAREQAANTKTQVLRMLIEIGEYSAARRKASSVDGLWDDADVRVARLAYLRQTQITGVHIHPTWYWYAQWLSEAEAFPELTAEREATLRLRERATALYDLDYRLRGAEFEMITQGWIEQLQAEVDTWGGEALKHWAEIIEKLRGILDDARRLQERDEAQARLEKAAFYPFRYWLVGYGYLTDGENGLVIETDTLPTLHAPDATGWLVDARHGTQVQVRAITTVTEVRVEHTMQIPLWPSCWRAGKDLRYKVPPEGAERL